jgi:hypothetical protein
MRRSSRKPKDAQEHTVALIDLAFVNVKGDKEGLVQALYRQGITKLQFVDSNQEDMIPDKEQLNSLSEICQRLGMEIEVFINRLLSEEVSCWEETFSLSEKRKEEEIDSVLVFSDFARKRKSTNITQEEEQEAKLYENNGNLLIVRVDTKPQVSSSGESRGAGEKEMPLWDDAIQEAQKNLVLKLNVILGRQKRKLFQRTNEQEKAFLTALEDLHQALIGDINRQDRIPLWKPSPAAVLNSPAIDIMRKTTKLLSGINLALHNSDAAPESISASMNEIINSYEKACKQSSSAWKIFGKWIAVVVLTGLAVAAGLAAGAVIGTAIAPGVGTAVGAGVAGAAAGVAAAGIAIHSLFKSSELEQKGKAAAQAGKQIYKKRE